MGSRFFWYALIWDRGLKEDKDETMGCLYGPLRSSPMAQTYSLPPKMEEDVTVTPPVNFSLAPPLITGNLFDFRPSEHDCAS